jgi:hypothetical protein
MHASLSNPEKLDLITFDPNSHEYVLIISTMNTWEDSKEEQERLLQKINNYTNFLADGQLLQHFPQAKGIAVRIQIDSMEIIPPNANQLVMQAQKLLMERGINLCINLISK